MSALPLPLLAEGEIYVGAIGDQKGEVYHLILLPGDSDPADWQAQMSWAKSIGGDLPNRLESAMLFIHLKDQFQTKWYWSSQQHTPESGWAWCHDFYDGSPGFDDWGNDFRARAIRREYI